MVRRLSVPLEDDDYSLLEKAKAARAERAKVELKDYTWEMWLLDSAKEDLRGRRS